MLPRDVLKRIRRIQIMTNRLVNESLAGEYHSVFKGRGMEFDEVREYQHGDDVRTIDWNVSSRTGRPFVKRYVEERELTVMLLVDRSASGSFGSAEKMKSEIAAEISALLAFSAIRNNDRVGAILFTDRVEKFVPPRRGSRHVLRLIREVLFHKPEHRGTSIRTAIELLNLVVRKHAVVFLISDLLDQGFEQALKAANRKHDVVIIQILDRLEKELPAIGLLEIRDAETGEVACIDTSLPWIQSTLRDNWNRNHERLLKFFESHRMDHVSIETGTPYDVPLVRFFKERAKTIR
ncbi:MAG: DUF58 domain-containing protein [Acidobacteria bacterium]|nr:DUF58 domain-containing protein [Acidobacteriota bacterium]